ncbi:DUF6114 domain-containing protein [Micromonospora sp. NPDC000089]|uniref:DUF6114 domain-containing protein n=1 Tax=unclassified Micromonospora TaxID=2617518 RepID=UPI003697FBA6
MTADAQHARPGGATRAWRGFQQWRRNRPFWGGLFTVLAGVEIFASTQASIAGLTLKMGPTGFLAWLIPTILVVCGLLMWFSPAQRAFYSIIAGVTALYSLIGVNLGGFFLGMLLGIVGAALGFAWVPGRSAAADVPPPDVPDDEPPADDLDDDESPLVDELMPPRQGESWDDRRTGVLTDTLPQPRNPLREPAPAQGRPVDDHSPDRDGLDSTQVIPAVDRETRPDGGSGRDPKLFAITLVLLSVSAVGLLAVRDQTPSQAAPATPAAPAACPTRGAVAPATPTPSAAKPSASAAKPSASGSPSATASPSATEGNLLTDLVHGIGDLLTGGTDDNPPPVEPGTDIGGSATTEPTATPVPSTAPTAGSVAAPTQARRAAAPTDSPAATGGASASTRGPAATAAAPKARPRPEGPRCVIRKPTGPAKVQPGKVLPRLAADPALPRVASQPSKLTGSRVKMSDLRFEGIAELDTAGGGKLRALKFSMSKAVTDDFKLVADGPSGRHQQYVTDQLTVKRNPGLPGGGTNVAFYATRFVGWLGPLKITLTPDLPFPDGIPITSPIPITFGKPVIDLAFVRSDTLTATPSLQLSLA